MGAVCGDCMNAKELILKEIEIINKRIEEISQSPGLRMNDAETVIYNDLCEIRKDLYIRMPDNDISRGVGVI